ncbi:MAG: triose-phosphate isomerase [Chloroflexota bacterium]|nr:triose-phosphate isomerase [Chloroflexota bacterium]
MVQLTTPFINRGNGNSGFKRLPIIAGNWKMNKTVDESLLLVDEMIDDLDAIEGVEIVLCPPFVALYSVLDLLEDTGVGLGAQNMYHQNSGAYTGEISPLMLREICDYVILGHSERRTYFGETNELVNLKVKAALKHDIRPIMAVGENLAQRQAEETSAFVTAQVREGLAGIDIADIPTIVLAYEPIWAIGTGLAATGAMAQEVCALIRQTVAELYTQEVAEQVRIQYGGSVTAKNIEEFMSQPDIDGGLVGGASLNADDFIQIVVKTLEVSSKK